MHRSRIGSIVIDCDDYAAGVAFWSAAVGARPDGDDGRWASIPDVVGGVRLLLQRVPEPKTSKTRVHLDIESDDTEAEVRRLEELGAKRAEPLKEGDGWILTDPCGNEFCVLTPQTARWPERTQTWG
jgi:predicted enzyme related to lactoylglutathione lyase